MLSHNLLTILVKGDELGLNTPGQVETFISTLAGRKVKTRCQNLILYHIIFYFLFFIFFNEKVTKILNFGGKTELRKLTAQTKVSGQIESKIHPPRLK